MGVLDEFGAVLDPDRAASDPTEAFLRGNLITGGITNLSDTKDFIEGNPSSPNKLVGVTTSVGRQFDDIEGGGIGDEALNTGGDLFAGVAGGIENAWNDATPDVPGGEDSWKWISWAIIAGAALWVLGPVLDLATEVIDE